MTEPMWVVAGYVVGIAMVSLFAVWLGAYLERPRARPPLTFLNEPAYAAARLETHLDPAYVGMTGPWPGPLPGPSGKPLDRVPPGVPEPSGLASWSEGRLLAATVDEVQLLVEAPAKSSPDCRSVVREDSTPASEGPDPAVGLELEVARAVVGPFLPLIQRTGVPLEDEISAVCGEVMALVKRYKAALPHAVRLERVCCARLARHYVEERLGYPGSGREPWGEEAERFVRGDE